MAERQGNLLDIEFLLKDGRSLIITEISIKIFDALRMQKLGEFDKRFIWGENTGVSVDSIAGWRIINQYND